MRKIVLYLQSFFIGLCRKINRILFDWATPDSRLAMASAGAFLEVSALDRLARPGMLYDATNHKIVPILSPWSKEQLETNVTTRKIPSFKVSACMSDSMVDKIESMDLMGDVKFDVMAGLFNASGSQKWDISLCNFYLKDSFVKRSHKRAAIVCKSTSRYVELNQDLLKRATNYEVVNGQDSLATHVIVGVKYGCDAVLEIDTYTATDNSDNEAKCLGDAGSGGNTAAIKEDDATSALTFLKDQISLAIEAKYKGKRKINAEKYNFNLEYYGEVPLDFTKVCELDKDSLTEAIKIMCEESEDRHVPKVLSLMSLSKLREQLSLEGMSCDEVYLLPNQLLGEIDDLMKDLMAKGGTLLSTKYSSPVNLDYLEFAAMYRKKLEEQVKKVSDEFRLGLSEQLPLARKSGDLTDLFELVRKVKDKKEALGISIKLSQLNDCVKLAESYHKDLTKICSIKQGSAKVTLRSVSLELCFEHLLPKTNEPDADQVKNSGKHMERIQKAFNDFRRIALVEDWNECKVGFKILPKDRCAKPAQLIFQSGGRTHCRDFDHVSTRNKKLKVTVINHREFRKLMFVDMDIVDTCRVLCKNLQSDEILFCENWDVSKPLRNLLSGAERYGFTFAARNEEKFWIPIHDEDFEVSTMDWPVKPFIRIDKSSMTSSEYENLDIIDKIEYAF